MKILYIGVFRDGTGWTQAATDYVLAMDSVGIDVVPRPIKLSPMRSEPPTRIKELEQKSDKGCNIVIQHILPSLMDYNGLFEKNIALFAMETLNFGPNDWIDKLQTMDEIWSINNEQKETCNRAGLKMTNRVIPHTVNVEKFQRSYEPIDISPLRDKFVFYFIGEFNRRKNLSAIIKAFNLEFTINEPVELVIKSSIPGLDEQSADNQIRTFCNEVKKGLKLYNSVENYKSEVLITQRLTEEHLMALHNACDCFVTASHGEAWMQPAMDALGFGNPVICPNSMGFREYVTKENGWLLPVTKERCFGIMDTVNFLHTSNEYWHEISVEDLRKSMREAFENKELYKNKSDKAKATPYLFSYEKIGNLIYENLSNTTS